MTTELTLDELKTAPVREVSEALCFKTPRQSVRGLTEILKQTGHDEREVLRQMAARHSPTDWQQHYAMRDADYGLLSTAESR
jgi:hypothetical protein